MVLLRHQDSLVRENPATLFGFHKLALGESSCRVGRRVNL